MVHCAASNPNAKAKDIQEWFLRSVAKGGRGWSKGGYAEIIEWNGTLVKLYDDEVPTNGVKAYKGVSNSNTLHICLVGGRTEGEISKEQKATLEKRLLEKVEKYPHAKLLGHNQVAVKACPNFDVRRYSKSIGIEDKNIFWEDYYEIATKMKQIIDTI